MKHDDVNQDDIDLLLADDDDLPAGRDFDDELDGHHVEGHQPHIVAEDDDDDDDDIPDVSALEDEDDESEGASEEPEVKKGISTVVVGAACAVAILGAGGAYVVLSKKGQDQQMPMVHTSMPAPSIADLGKDMNIPSTNLAEDDIEKAIDPKASAATSVQPKPQASDAPAVSLATKVEAQEPVKVLAAKPNDVSGLDSKIQDKPVSVASSVVPVVPVSESSNPSLPSAVAIASNSGSSGESSQNSDDSNLSKEDVQLIVKDALKQSGNDDIRKKLADIEKALKGGQTPGAPYQQVDKEKVVAEIKAEEAKQEADKRSEDDQKIASAVQGKQRLPGFQVVNATKDGTISIIKSPGGRTFALFKGEQFHALSGKNLVVTDIISEGRLVVAGDSWYIDETLVDTPKVVDKKANRVESSAQKTERVERQVPKAKEASSVSGWSLDGTFEGGGYLLKSPTGEYKTVTKGDSDPVLGQIVGIDDQGALKTSKGLIKSSQ